MIIVEDKNRGFVFFDFFLRILALTHWFWLVAFEYYFFNPTTSYRYPIIEFFSHNSVSLHTGIFIVYTIVVFLFVLRKSNYLFSFLISLCLFYFEFHDKYSFHQDIFLAINIFFLFSFAKYYDIKNKLEPKENMIFTLKALCSIVYFFAAFHKINPYFHSGILLNDILINGPLKFFITEIPNEISKTISYFTLIVELSFPILIWTKWKRIACILAMCLHFGIAIFGIRGMLFNLYLPSLWLLFFSFPKVDIIDVRFKKILTKINISNNVEFKKMKIKEFKKMMRNVILFNPIFLSALIILIFNLIIISRKLIMNFL